MKQTTLRLPDELYKAVERQAEQDRRSVNAEMVWLLEQGIRKGEEETVPNP